MFQRKKVTGKIFFTEFPSLNHRGADRERRQLNPHLGSSGRPEWGCQSKKENITEDQFNHNRLKNNGKVALYKVHWNRA